MLNCHEATKLLSDRMERALTRRQRLALTLHVMLCNACRNCGKQMEFLRRAGRRFAEPERNGSDGNDVRR